MKGKDTFTKNEMARIKQLIIERCHAPSSKQKAIRDKMRAIGFYGSDFGIKDMTIEKFENLIRDGRIKIIKEGTAISQGSIKEQIHTTSQEKVIESFPPLINENSEILILGTMPRNDSLSLNQYYASSNNSFWEIISALFHEGKGFKNYEEKTACLKKHHIALWDVLSSCNREGSLDSNIHDEELNDIDTLLEEYPNIRRIIFNGKKPSEYYTPPKRIDYAVAQSTSNANAKKLDVKIEDWATKLKR